MKQRKQRNRLIRLSPFPTKERRCDVLHVLFLEKLGENGEKNTRQCLSTESKVAYKNLGNSGYNRKIGISPDMRGSCILIIKHPNIRIGLLSNDLDEIFQKK